MKLLKLLANLGYGSRKQVMAMFRDGAVTDAQGEVMYADDEFDPTMTLLVDGEPMDPAPGFAIMLNKPIGYTCSTKDVGKLVYDLLPPRFKHRSPNLSTVGRLDKDTSGMLLMTDDGQLLHRIVSPKKHLPKIYQVTLDRPLNGNEAAVFASGTLVLESETEALKPAKLEIIDDTHAELTLWEGRYHQVRRMFAAVGNHVTALHRTKTGGLELGDLADGEWRFLDEVDLTTLFEAPDAR